MQRHCHTANETAGISCSATMLVQTYCVDTQRHPQAGSSRSRASLGVTRSCGSSNDSNDDGYNVAQRARTVTGRSVAFESSSRQR